MTRAFFFLVYNSKALGVLQIFLSSNIIIPVKKNGPNDDAMHWWWFTSESVNLFAFIQQLFLFPASKAHCYTTQ